MLTTADMCAAIVAHLERADASLLDLRRLTGMNDQQIEQLLSGQRMPCLRHRRTIAAMVGVQPGDLLVEPDHDEDAPC